MKLLQFSCKVVSGKCGVAFLIVASFILFIAGCSQQSVQNAKTEVNYIKDSTGFRFILPDSCINITDDDLGTAIRKLNPTIFFIGEVNLLGENRLLSASTYLTGEMTNVDTAFYQTVGYKATLADEKVDSYELVDWGMEKVDNKILRYKISCYDSRIFSIMFYFMEAQYSDVFNEIKITCSKKEEIEVVKAYLEKVALTVNYQRDKQ